MNASDHWRRGAGHRGSWQGIVDAGTLSDSSSFAPEISDASIEWTLAMCMMRGLAHQLCPAPIPLLVLVSRRVVPFRCGEGKKNSKAKSQSWMIDHWLSFLYGRLTAEVASSFVFSPVGCRQWVVDSGVSRIGSRLWTIAFR